MPSAAAAAIALLIAAHAAATPSPSGARADVARRACAGLAARVDAIPGDGPALLRSYDAADGMSEPESPALRSAAFTYDNAVATIALIACRDLPHATRIGRALLAAAQHENVRNAYRAGAVDSPPLPNGWWDGSAKRWNEDAYQNGTATGSAAWVGLALLQIEQALRDRGWGEVVYKTSLQLAAATEARSGPGGFAGGTIGFDKARQPVGWRSTEHNIDLAALFGALARRSPDSSLVRDRATHARRFLDAMWDAPSGHFWIGTLDDGTTLNRDNSALDAQLWAQLLPRPAPDWRRALRYVEQTHAVSGGFDFNADRDGAWLEGTAQAALVYRRARREADARAMFATLDANFAPNGLLYATREARISTGLAAGTAKSADFYYYRLPHVGATAWAALAAENYNPFVVGGK